MIGKKQLIIDASDFVKGMSSGNDVSDGGFSNSTTAVNLIANPGVMYPPATVTDKSTNLVGDIIASCEDPKATPDTRLFVSSDVDQDGRFYLCNSVGTLTAVGAEYATANFVAGKTDMIPYRGEVYVTTATTIVRWERATDTFDGGDNFPFSFTDNLAPHPALVYENNAYFGDGNLLYYIPSSASLGDAPTVILTLSDSQVIVALGIDNSTGLMMISTVDQLNASGTVNSKARILLYDGNSAKVARVVIVDEMVNAFYNNGGTTFVTYGTNFGYWNGSGVNFLRKLKNVTLDNTQLAYKHHITNIGRTLYVVDGAQVLAYGEVIPGRKVFYYAQTNNVSAAKYDCITSIGNNLLILAFTSAKSYTFDVNSTTTDGFGTTFVTNKYLFPRPIFLRKAYVEYADAVVNGDANRTLAYLTENQSGFATLSVLTNSSGANVNFTDNIIGFLNNKCRMVQIRYQGFTTVTGLRRIILYYDDAE